MNIQFNSKISQRGKIGVDLDDVLLEFNEGFRVFHNKKYGTNYSISDIKSWELGYVMNCPQNEVARRVEEFYYSDDHEKLEPVKGAIDVLKKISKNNDIYVVTARPEHTKEKTINLVEKYFKNIFKDYIFTGIHHGSGNIKNKGEICKELGVSFFVDDGLHNAEHVAMNGIPVFLFDRPWNQKNNLDPLIRRVISWSEITF